MTKRQAKSEACFCAALIVQNKIDCGWERYEEGDDGREQFDAAMRELVLELHRRGRKYEETTGGEA
jgi:hypothetical protein